MAHKAATVGTASETRPRATNQMPATAHRAVSPELLTLRQRQVLKLIIEGNTSKRIAAHFGLSVRTVEVHRSHIRLKLRTNSLAELVKVALSSGLCDKEGLNKCPTLLPRA